MSGWSDLDLVEVLFRCDTLGQTMAQAAAAVTTTRSAISGALKRLRDAAPQLEALRLRDHEVLAIVAGVLDGTRDAEAMAKTFADKRRMHVTRMAVLYLVWWVMNDAAVARGSDAVKPDNQDWVAWPSWWRPVAAVGVAA
jgi:ABC-type transporter Mla subunit MlaD